MTDSRHRQPAVDEAPHTIPKDTAILAAPRQRAMPEPPHLEPKDPQRRYVHGHPVVTDVSTHDRLQPFAQFGDGFVHAPPKFGFHRVQLRLQPFANRLPQHRKPSIAPLLYANVCKAEKVERPRFPFSIRIRFPSSSTPALSHFWINRTTRRSATRCSMNLTSHSWESPSKKLLTSRSSTQFTFLVSSPV